MTDEMGNINISKSAIGIQVVLFSTTLSYILVRSSLAISLEQGAIREAPSPKESRIQYRPITL